MVTITLLCSGCGLVFEKPVREHNRCLRKGQTKFYCSRKCFALYSVKVKHLNNVNRYELRQHAGNHRDNLTPFRYFHKIIRARARKVRRKQFDVTIAELQDLWSHQNGVCPFTGWKMKLPISTVGLPEKRHPKNASLDRIDPNEGYSKREPAIYLSYGQCGKTRK
jgi:hypothetical protein